jgi:hypothetical protein
MLHMRMHHDTARSCLCMRAAVPQCRAYEPSAARDPSRGPVRSMSNCGEQDPQSTHRGNSSKHNQLNADMMNPRDTNG